LGANKLLPQGSPLFPFPSARFAVACVQRHQQALASYCPSQDSLGRIIHRPWIPLALGTLNGGGKLIWQEVVGFR